MLENSKEKKKYNKKKKYMKTPPKGDNKSRYNSWVYFFSIVSQFFVDLKFLKFSHIFVWVKKKEKRVCKLRLAEANLLNSNDLCVAYLNMDMNMNMNTIINMIMIIIMIMIYS